MTFLPSLRGALARRRHSSSPAAGTTGPSPTGPSPDTTTSPDGAAADDSSLPRATAAADTGATVPAAGSTAADGAGRSRRALAVGGLAAALVLTGGAVVTAAAHKTVTLDVDGQLTEVTTFAGSVGGLLDSRELELGSRDVVAPAVAAPLQDGDDVVLRRAREVVVLADGQESRVWTTALTADAALAGLAARGEDVRLMASRSGGQGRADLGVRLVDGPVDVVVDGRTEQVADGSVGLDRVLTDLGVTLGELDRVSVQRPTDGERLTVVVQRVVAQEQATVTELPFERTTEPTDELYKGRSETAVAGVPGERTTVHRVVLVDGVEESRLQLSDAVTRQPVTEVVREGTKPRPAPAPAPPRAPAPRAAGGAPAAQPAPVGGDVWAALARCESGGNPTIVSRNGLYHGLYQFSVATWRSVGGSGLPSQASPAEQTQRAQALQARSGWGQWPACSRKLGLR